MRSLFIGNIDEVVKDTIKYFDKQFDRKNNDIYRKKKLDYKKLFECKQYDNVFYFAKNLDNDIDDLNNFLQVLDCSNDVNKYFFVIRNDGFGLDFNCSNIEIIKEILNCYINKKRKNIIILNVSCLYSNKFIDGEINRIDDKNKYSDVYANYIHVDDFSRFLHLIAIHKLEVNYVDFRANVSVNVKNLLSNKVGLNAREENLNYPFDFEFKHSILNDISDGLNLVEILKFEVQDRERHPIIKGLEIIVMFFIAEVLVNIFNTTFNIQYIDFRLIFMIFVSVYYEFGYSLFATCLVILSFFFINIDNSYDFSVILTNTDNWVSIIIYLVMAIVIRSRISRFENHIKEADEKITLLDAQNKQKHRNILKYEARIKNLNRSIITNDNSLAKVSKFINNCRVVNDESIYEMFVDNLGTSNVVVFQVNRNRFNLAYTRCEVDYSYLVKEKVSTFITNEGVWSNFKLNKEFPLYMVPIFDGDKVCYVVSVWDYDIGIMNNDFRNNLLSLANIVSFLKESER